LSVLILKSLHLIFAISWFSGLFFWIRMMVYHAEAIEMGRNQDVLDLMALAQRRIQTFVLNPAVVGTFGFGVALMVVTRAYTLPWFHVKLTLVFGVLALHIWLWRMSRQFGSGVNGLKSRSFRMINELPFVLLVGIVFTAVFRLPTAGLKAMAVLIGLVGAVMVLIRSFRR